MELRYLTTFIEVAELGSFTKASEKLGFSQPTVSFQIKQLETELGTQLFDRIGHTVCLTENGKKILSYAQHICHLSQEMLSGDNRNTEPEGTVRLAMADSLCTPLIFEHFKTLRSLYPKVSLKITSAGTSEMFRLLDHNETDIVCTLDNHIYSNAYVISSEEKVSAHFICSVNSPLAKMKNLDLNTLISEPFLLTEKGMSYRRHLDETLAKLSLEINPILEISSADMICSLVAENLGISFLPDYVTEMAVKNGSVVRLEMKDIEIELWKQIIYRRDKWVSSPMQVVIEHLSKILLMNK